MPVTTPNTYLRTQVMTAGPTALRLMLFDGAIRFAEQARRGLTEADPEASYNGVTRCQAILIELMNSLQPEHDAELCDKLASLYTFMYTKLIQASVDQDAPAVDEVIELLRFERETWKMLIDQQGGEAPDPADLASLEQRDGDGTSLPDQIIGGSVSLQG